MIKNKKLLFKSAVVRQLTQSMTEDELRGVAGGTMIIVRDSPLPQYGLPTNAPVAGGIRSVGSIAPTTQCPSVADPMGQC